MKIIYYITNAYKLSLYRIIHLQMSIGISFGRSFTFSLCLIALQVSCGLVWFIGLTDCLWMDNISYLGLKIFVIILIIMYLITLKIEEKQVKKENQNYLITKHRVFKDAAIAIFLIIPVIGCILFI